MWTTKYKFNSNDFTQYLYFLVTQLEVYSTATNLLVVVHRTWSVAANLSLSSG